MFIDVFFFKMLKILVLYCNELILEVLYCLIIGSCYVKSYCFINLRY